MTLQVAMAIYEHDQWDSHMLMDNYKLFPKSPSSSSLASASSSISISTYHSIESGISSMSPECPNLLYNNCSTPTLESLTYSAFEKIKIDSPNSSIQEDESTTEIVGEEILKEHSVKEKVMYEGRDLLNLASNIRTGWQFPMTELPTGMNRYFENRSQYSRIKKAFPPPHKNHLCPDEDCSFVMPIYY